MNREHQQEQPSAAVRMRHPVANSSLRGKLLLFALALVKQKQHANSASASETCGTSCASTD